MRKSALLFALLSSVVLGLGACSSAAGEDIGPDAGDLTGGEDCRPNICGAADCGTTSDGCGGTMDCGSCEEQCMPDTCEPDACGLTADGCGGTMDCGACAVCDNDSLMGNDNSGSAADLGTYTDNSKTMDVLTDLVLIDGEQDWFSLGATDACCLGNPKPGVAITAPNASADIQVMMGYVCGNASTATFECVGGVFDEGLGACVMTVPAGSGETWLQLDKLNCSGTNESGNALIQVMSESGSCEPYDLSYEVTK